MTRFRISRSLAAADFACDEGGPDGAVGRAADGLDALKALKAWNVSASSTRTAPPPHQDLYRALASLTDTSSSRQQELTVICRTLDTVAGHLSSTAAAKEQGEAEQDLTRRCIFWCGHGVQAVEVSVLPGCARSQQRGQSSTRAARRQRRSI